MSTESNSGVPERAGGDNSQPIIRTSKWGWMLAAFVAGILGKAYGIPAGVVMLAVFFFLQAKAGPVNAIVVASGLGVAAGLGVSALLGN